MFFGYLAARFTYDALKGRHNRKNAKRAMKFERKQERKQTRKEARAQSWAEASLSQKFVGYIGLAVIADLIGIAAQAWPFVIVTSMLVVGLSVASWKTR